MNMTMTTRAASAPVLQPGKVQYDAASWNKPFKSTSYVENGHEYTSNAAVGAHACPGKPGMVILPGGNLRFDDPSSNTLGLPENTGVMVRTDFNRLNEPLVTIYLFRQDDKKFAIDFPNQAPAIVDKIAKKIIAEGIRVPGFPSPLAPRAIITRHAVYDFHGHTPIGSLESR
jgi:hypothetical protein